MKIQGLEKLSMVDYDGYAACTVFLSGCNLRCPFCQNAVLVESALPEFISEDEFFAFLEKRKGLLDAVAITGGEPTLRRDLADFCRRIKAAGYRVKLDSNGTRPAVLKELVENGLVDYIAMDVKCPPADYPDLMGCDEKDLEAIKESVAFLKTAPLPYEFRTTLVDELHDERSIRSLGEFVRGARELWLQKFVDRGGCLTDGLHEVPYKRAEAYAEILSKFVGNVGLRGYV
ncbi:MAG: anaerobic ribonucleoside-triphosphate reductase activating protein [Clostridia bacterium]|nr:anaerobic ribonucleoside-triphosphate reductase activating protein [Clostridia bacterium]